MTELQEFYDEIPHGKATEFRNRCIEACTNKRTNKPISKAYWRLWTNGFPVPKEYHNVIDEIAFVMFGRTVFLEKEEALIQSDQLQ